LLAQHTIDQLRALRLDGMLAALHDGSTSAAEALPFAERLALLVQREIDHRDERRLQRLLKTPSSRSAVLASRRSTGAARA
jgi:hypothetical protein